MPVMRHVKHAVMDTMPPNLVWPSARNVKLEKKPRARMRIVIHVSHVLRDDIVIRRD